MGLLISRRAAVLGRPITHSLSPLLHCAAYRALDLDWQFEAIDIASEGLPELLASRGSEWVGFACTMPLKRVALKLAATATSRAQMVGAANTLLRARDGQWSADNTDVAGILAALGEHDVRPATVSLLGAGGTAQAAVVALRELGVGRAVVVVRDASRVEDLAATATRAGFELDVRGFADSDALCAELVISTLPAGAADPLVAHPWQRGQALLDVVYAPWPTPLAAAVTRAGGTVVSGALMLLHQASVQVELMTGHAAPVAAMRAALREAVPGCGV